MNSRPGCSRLNSRPGCSSRRLNGGYQRCELLGYLTECMKQVRDGGLRWRARHDARCARVGVF